MRLAAPAEPAIAIDGIDGIDDANVRVVVSSAAVGAPESVTVTRDVPTTGGSGANATVALAAPNVVTIGVAFAGVAAKILSSTAQIKKRRIPFTSPDSVAPAMRRRLAGRRFRRCLRAAPLKAHAIHHASDPGG